MATTEPRKPGKMSIFVKVSESLEKSGEELKGHICQRMVGGKFRATLDSQHPCSKLSVATKGVALNACSPLKFSRLAIPPLVRKNVREFCFHFL